MNYLTPLEIFYKWEKQKQNDIFLKIDVGVGKSSSTVYTCDLTHKYIDINADYRS